MLAVHFVRAAIEGWADTLIIASRDTDLVPAVEMAVTFGKARIETCMWGLQPPSAARAPALVHIPHRRRLPRQQRQTSVLESAASAAYLT
jgi:hypothetical protein